MPRLPAGEVNEKTSGFPTSFLWTLHACRGSVASRRRPT